VLGERDQRHQSLAAQTQLHDRVARGQAKVVDEIHPEFWNHVCCAIHRVANSFAINATLD